MYKEFHKTMLIIFMLVSILGIVFLADIQNVSAQLSFGGKILFYFPACYEGTWIILGPPKPGNYMYAPGTISYSAGPPSHIGQSLLGLSTGFLTCTIQCGPSPCVIGGGQLIMLHGSSVI